MQKYEMLYIVAGDLTDEQKDAVMQKVDTIITKNAGVIENVEKIGMKKFAYPINYKSEGFYVLVNFNSEVETSANSIGKQLNITDGVVRHMIVAK
ncbi:MAG: 30S ribosomal protein S6 [Clostridia bacterium]|nr:30S ribosomal protein S6 [Clostridia bacterium]